MTRWLLALTAASAIGCTEPPPRPTTPSPAPEPAEPRPLTPSRVPAEAGKRVDFAGRAMGTQITLAAYTTSEHNEAMVRDALRAAHQEITRLEALMTTHRDDSDVSRVNAAAGKEPVKVSEETFEVIAKSLWISKLSKGTFDITFASMGDLWRFDEDAEQRVPDAEAIEAGREKIDYRKVKIDREAQTVRLEGEETRIHLGGIAKGYAVDRAADVLRDRGLPSFYVQAGGDLYVEGTKPSGQPWRVGVRDPRGPGKTYFAVLPVEDHAFSTAGDYERAFIEDGKRYHHIIDPRTGYPATASRSVTIWAKDALTADAIDDAVFILGPVEGMRLVESIDDCGAVIVDEHNGVHVSPRLEGVVKILREPTPGI